MDVKLSNNDQEPERDPMRTRWNFETSHGMVGIFRGHGRSLKRGPSDSFIVLRYVEGRLDEPCPDMSGQPTSASILCDYAIPSMRKS